ncbi:hypothetical protein [Ilumatobacter nonamiensis]|uniref:hypothetical protein n=1 Tax=Ilumatobacter nonamiensis TaxID=467093 RepID=UPI000347AC06|nr:hypothetical protein [Ilumatobacter nonamiensis]
MSRAAPLVLAIALLAGACSGGSDEAAPTTTTPATTEAPPATESNTPTTDETTTTATVAPTTTVDEATLLAEAEAAYLEAFEVGKEVIRNPEDPDNEAQIRDHFSGQNLDGTLADLRRAIDGGFIAVESPQNPSTATIIEPARFKDDARDVALLSVCEFNSDRIFEVGAAPGEVDVLRRDDPVSIILTAQMVLVDGSWKLDSGTRGDEIRDEVSRCSDVA